ncbi:MAG: caspase family protein [Elusimicrobiota bacterium]
MNMFKRVIPLALVLSVSGCAFDQVNIQQQLSAYDTKRLSAPPPGKGLLYIVRRPRVHQLATRLDVYIDAKKVGLLTNKSYLNFAVEPGERKIAVMHPQAKYTIAKTFRENAGRAAVQVEAGKTYYLKTEFLAFKNGGGVFSELLDEEAGKAMVAKSILGIYGSEERVPGDDQMAGNGHAAVPSQAPPPAVRPAAATAERKVSDVDTPGYHSKERPDDFAVVIGIDGYKNLPDAQFAERDAQTMRDHLIAMGYPKRHVVLLKGDAATGNGMRKYLEEWLPRNVKPTSNVFFYYSGHGAPDVESGKAYLVPWDGDASFLKSTAYPVGQLYASLNKLRAKRIVVALDACFSGAGGRSVLAKGARPLVMKVDEGISLKGGIALFTAASGTEITTTLEDEGHGIFTYYFIKGLQGAAKNAAGRITARSLYQYLKPKVQDEARLQNREQTPTAHYKSDVVLRAD